MKVRVHQNLMLSLLLFAIVKDALTGNLIKTMKEFWYADNLVLIGGNWKEVCRMEKGFRK